MTDSPAETLVPLRVTPAVPGGEPFGNSPPPATNVPEPTFALLILLAFLFRRRTARD